MKKLLLIIIVCSGISCPAFSQTVKLTAVYDARNSVVKLNWNMVNSSSTTGYLLLRSSDGITWSEAAKVGMLRNYSHNDEYFFNDRLFSPGKNFYRVRIFDANNNTIALSPVVIVITPGRLGGTTTSPANTQKQTTVKESIVQPKSNNSWVLYPNPASDFLTLTYKGSEELKGVVNVQIQDARGKTVIRFRSGSLYKTIQIPISSLQRGTYVIQLSVLNEFMMNQGFIKK